MAIETHNITTDDVLDRLPLETSRITATSKGLDTGQLDAWVVEAAGQLNALLSRAGADVDNLDDKDTELVRAGILAYAVARALEVANASDDQINRHWSQWLSTKDIVSTSPDTLSGRSDSFHTNIPNRDADEGRRFSGDGWTGY